jgi:hypothetical protein
LVRRGAMLEKQCTKCKDLLPATTDYFYKKENGLYGLFAWCKRCHIKITTPNAVKWNRENPDRAKEHQNKYRSTHNYRQKQKGAVERWRARNLERAKEIARESSKRWYDANKERARERMKRYMANRKVQKGVE